MSKWKCEICGDKFDNFHAQGFDNKIYCPLCYFKKENKELKQKYENAVADYEAVMFENKQLKDKLELLINDLKINKEKEKEEGKSYFNTDLVAIRVLEIYKILKGSDNNVKD